MNPKKMKLVLAASVALNVVLIVVMMVLKSGYKEQAQASFAAESKAYTDQTSQIVNAQNEFITNGNKIWQIVFESVTQKFSRADFDARLSAIDPEKTLKPETSNDQVSLSCGVECHVRFQFKNGKFESVDYKEFAAISPSATFSVAKPAPFRFEAK